MLLVVGSAVLSQECVETATATDPAVAQPVEKLLAWQIPALGDIQGLVLPPDASSTSIKRTTDKRNWVWGAMMIGMYQWAEASGNETLWEWLQVLFTSIAVLSEL